MRCMQKDYCSQKRKSANQANQEDEKAECFHFYEIDDLYCWFRSEVKKQQRDVKCEARKKEDQKTKWKWWEWWRWIYREHDEWFKFELSDEWADEWTDW
jgi:hypothetical protein